jgi:hypothetical protein
MVELFLGTQLQSRIAIEVMNLPCGHEPFRGRFGRNIALW